MPSTNQALPPPVIPAMRTGAHPVALPKGSLIAAIAAFALVVAGVLALTFGSDACSLVISSALGVTGMIVAGFVNANLRPESAR